MTTINPKPSSQQGFYGSSYILQGFTNQKSWFDYTAICILLYYIIE